MKNFVYNDNLSIPLDKKTDGLIRKFNEIYGYIKNFQNKNSFEKESKQLKEILHEIFEFIQKNISNKNETIFFKELSDYSFELLDRDLLYFRGREKMGSPNNPVKKKKYINGRIGIFSKFLIRILTYSHIKKLKKNASKGLNTREELSINRGLTIFLLTRILDIEFRRKKIISFLSDYKRKKLMVEGLSLEISIPSKWWEDKEINKTPKTTYLHFDESIGNPKSIMYLSRVKSVNGPFSILRDPDHYLKFSPIQFLIGRIVGNVGRNGSKIQHLFNHKYHQTLGCEFFKSFFDKIPKEMKFNSHFGFDVIKNSELETSLLKKELSFEGNFGDYFIFDGSETLHRGGLIKENTRIVFQIIFGTRKKNYLADKIKSYLKRNV